MSVNCWDSKAGMYGSLWGIQTRCIRCSWIGRGIELIQALNLAAQHADRTFGQGPSPPSACPDRGSDWRVVRFGVGFGTRRMPNILLTSEGHHVYLAVIKSGSAAGSLEGYLDAARMIPVFIHHENRPITVGPTNCIGSHQRVTRRISDGSIHAKQVMHAPAMRDPLVVDHASRVILRGELANFEIRVGNIVSISRPPSVAARLK